MYYPRFICVPKLKYFDDFVTCLLRVTVKVNSLDSQIESLNLTSQGQGKTKKAAKKISAENMLSMIAGTNARAVVRGSLGYPSIGSLRF